MKYFLTLITIIFSLSHTQASETDMNPKKLYPYLIDDYFVYVDEANNIVLPTRYSHAEPFDGDVAVVTVEGKKGVIDTNGNWVLKPKFDKLRIERKGTAQLFVTSKAYVTRYEVHRWRFLPNLSVFSGYRPPFIGTKIARTKWQVFDREGNKVYSVNQDNGYDDYNDQGQISNRPFKIWDHGGLIHIDAKNRDIKTFNIKNGRVTYHTTLKDVAALTQKGYLKGQKNSDIAILVDYDNKVIDRAPYTFHQNISGVTNVGTGDLFVSSVWRHKDEYVCIKSKDDDFVTIPTPVMNKAISFLLPLDKSGDLFWIRLEGCESGIVDRKGEWVFTEDDIYFGASYSDGSVSFYRKDPKQPLLFEKGKVYIFPENTTLSNWVSDNIWILKTRVDKERKYGVYDADTEKWLMEPGDYVSVLSTRKHFLRETKFYPSESSTFKLVSYSVIDMNNKQITKGDYQSMWRGSDDLLYVMERASGKSFYLKMETGEELRKMDGEE